MGIYERKEEREFQRKQAAIEANQKFWIFKSRRHFALYLYLFLILMGAVLALLDIWGLLPPLIILGSTFGLANLGMLWALTDEPSLSDAEEHGGIRKKTVFFMDK